MSAQQIVLFLTLNHYGFRESFPARFVNSIYFDSHDLRFAKDNIEGLAERTKIRIRWYGENQNRMQQPVLEFKHKRGLAGYKVRHSMVDFGVGGEGLGEVLPVAIKDSNLPVGVAEIIHTVNPTLICRYRRRYFETVGLAVRATVDEKLYYRPVGRSSEMLDRGINDFFSVILELKYDPDLEDLVKEITNEIPIRLSKSSKYLMGLGRLRGAY